MRPQTTINPDLDQNVIQLLLYVEMKLRDKISEVHMKTIKSNNIDAEHFDGSINDKIDVRFSDCKLRICKACLSHFASR